MKSKRQSITGSTTDAIINYLTSIGFLVWRNNTTGVWDERQQIFRKNKKQMKGIPDIQGIDWIGRSVNVEVKTGKDRLSADQTKFAAECIARNGLYCIAKNIQDVIDTLRYYRYNINENGMVCSLELKVKITNVIMDQAENIPNANLLKSLDQMEKATLTMISTGKMFKQNAKLYLGKYAERII
jgi:hypothetical protein